MHIGKELPAPRLFVCVLCWFLSILDYDSDIMQVLNGIWRGYFVAVSGHELLAKVYFDNIYSLSVFFYCFNS